MIAVEVKSGGGVRTALQVTKDNLMATEGQRLLEKMLPLLVLLDGT